MENIDKNINEKLYVHAATSVVLLAICIAQRGKSILELQ